MRAFDNGSLFSCSVSYREVDAFNESWPCSTLPSQSIWFQFDKRNGDLVDMRPQVDGPEALALAQDAQNYAAKALKLPDFCFRK